MEQIRVRVQMGDSPSAFNTEVIQPHTEIGDVMKLAQNLGGAALETINVSLLRDRAWTRAVVAENLPTMFPLQF